jgi:hypothetical protein
VCVRCTASVCGGTSLLTCPCFRPFSIAEASLSLSLNCSCIPSLSRPRTRYRRCAVQAS